VGRYRKIEPIPINSNRANLLLMISQNCPVIEERFFQWLVRSYLRPRRINLAIYCQLDVSRIVALRVWNTCENYNTDGHASGRTASSSSLPTSALPL